MQVLGNTNWLMEPWTNNVKTRLKLPYQVVTN